MESCFAQYSALYVTAEHGKLLDNGNSFYPAQTLEKKKYPQGEWVRVYREEGRFYGIYTYDNERNWYKPVKMFL